MNINDIMARDIHEDEERTRRALARAVEHRERRTAREDAWILAVIAIAVAFAALGAAFCAGIRYQSARDLEESQRDRNPAEEPYLELGERYGIMLTDAEAFTNSPISAAEKAAD